MAALRPSSHWMISKILQWKPFSSLNFKLWSGKVGCLFSALTWSSRELLAGGGMVLIYGLVPSHEIDVFFPAIRSWRLTTATAALKLERHWKKSKIPHWRLFSSSNSKWKTENQNNIFMNDWKMTNIRVDSRGLASRESSKIASRESSRIAHWKKKASRKPEQKDQTKKKDRKKKKEVRIEVLKNPHQSPLGRWLTIIRFQIVAVLARLIFWRKFNDLLEFTLATINLLSGLEAVSSILAYIGGTCWSFNCRVICCDLSLLHNVHYKVYYFVI